ncbi:hypothetical protein [Mangrovicoccus sp. HB161399]|nr:hypothetical protein [Mangrovicoccus sp. HB161399]
MTATAAWRSAAAITAAKNMVAAGKWKQPFRECFRQGRSGVVATRP